MAAANCKAFNDDWLNTKPATDEDTDKDVSSPDCAAGEQQAGPAKRSREETEDNNDKPAKDSKHSEAAKTAKRNDRSKQPVDRRRELGVPAGSRGWSDAGRVPGLTKTMLC